MNTMNPMNDPEILARRIMPDGREATVIPLTYGRARLCIGQRGSMFYDDGF